MDKARIRTGLSIRYLSIVWKSLACHCTAQLVHLNIPAVHLSVIANPSQKLF